MDEIGYAPLHLPRPPEHMKMRHALILPLALLIILAVSMAMSLSEPIRPCPTGEIWNKQTGCAIEEVSSNDW